MSTDTKRKVLIIEDEKPISDIIKFNLTREGYDVETAYDGQEGLDKALSCGCSLVCPQHQQNCLPGGAGSPHRSQ